jgi:hypothetical protein
VPPWLIPTLAGGTIRADRLRKGLGSGPSGTSRRSGRKAGVPEAGAAYRVGLAALQWPFRAVGAVLAGTGLPDIAPVLLSADATDLVALPILAVPLALGLGRRAVDPVDRGG